MSGLIVKLSCERLVNIENAELIDYVGGESNLYRVYKIKADGKILLHQKASGAQTYAQFDNPDPEIVKKMDLMRSLPKPLPKARKVIIPVDMEKQLN